MRQDCGRFDGVWALEQGQCPNESSSKLDAVATQPDTRTLDQAGERPAQPFDAVADLSRIDIRRGVLKATLKNVEFVQQGCLIFGQSVVG
jgi:hypothetical protein